MEDTRYGIRVHVAAAFEAALDQVKQALQEQGFGVLTSIDVQQTLKQKINRDFRKYVILGACNPVLADRALNAELEIGLVLPCNVVVYEREGGGSTVAAMAPRPAMVMVGNPNLDTVAADAEARLRSALKSLETPASVAG